MTLRDLVVRFGFDIDRNSERQVENSIKGIKNMATKLLGGIAVVLSISSLSSFAKDCVEAASDVEEMQNKFDTVFYGITDDVEQWAENFAKAVGRNRNTIKGYLADQQNLLVGFGMTREEGAKLSEEMTSLALDLASFANTDETAAVNAMTKAVMGESEAAKTLGAVLSDTTRAETMAAMGLSGTYNSLDQLTKMQVNYQTILRQSPDAIGDCIRSMDSYEARTRQLNSAIAEFKEFIGGQLLPVFAVFIGWITQGVKAATAFAKAIFLDKEENNRLLKVFERIHAVVKRLQPEMERFAQSVRDGISRAADVVKAIAGRLGGMENLLKVLSIAAGAFLFAMNWTKVIGAVKVFMSLLSGMGKMFSLASLKLLAIVAVVVALALIVEDFIHFLMGNDSVIGTIFDKMGIGADNARQAIFNAWGAVKDFLLNVWDFIKQAAGMFADTVKGFFERHGDSIQANFERAWGIIKTFLNGVWTFISQLAAALFGGTEDSIGGSTQSTKDKLLSVWQTVLEKLSAVWDTLYKAGSAAFNAIAAGIEAVFGWIQAFWDKWGSEILAWFKVVWDSIGGIMGAFLNIVTGVANFISSVFTGDWKGAWDAIKQIFTGIWGAIVSFSTAVLETFKLLFEMAFSAIQGTVVSALTAIYDFFSSIFGSIASFVGSTFENILNGIISTVASIKGAIVNGIGAAVDWIKGLPEEAVQWGADFIGSLRDGILSGVQGIVDAVEGIGDKIRSFLHFSVPDEGPLTDYEAWMPDFMGGLARGISENEETVLDKVKSLAQGIQTLMSAATANAATAAAGTVNNTTSSVTQNVNIENSYSGGSVEAQKNISRGMKKSATDATTQMARALAYARG